MNTLIFDSRTERDRSPGVGRAVLMTTTGWFAVVLSMALAGAFETAAGERPFAILIAVILPVAIYGMAYLGLNAFRAWVLALDMRPLILLHSWRMVGAGFVMLYFYDRLPALFALPAGVGDAMVAVAAVFVGIALYQRPETVPRYRIYLWNTFGLVDFIVAVSLGVLTRTGEILHAGAQAGSDIMSSFPLALIPGFAVPFYFITHLIIYAQLRRHPG